MLENLVYNIEAVSRKRGCGSSDTPCRTATPALVQTALNPPPAWSRYHVIGKACAKKCIFFSVAWAKWKNQCRLTWDS